MRFSKYILLLIVQCYASKSSSILRKVCLNSTQYPFARCNDGSHGCYYTDAEEINAVDDGIGAVNRSSLVVYFMGGGFSFDNLTMQERFSNDEFLTTSTLLPDSIVGTNLMSSDSLANPSFAQGFVHTFVPYCSSDLWLGAAQSTSSTTLNDDDLSVPPAGKLEVDFLGHYIVEAVLTDMIGSYLAPYEDNGVVILSGASAGGIGASAHIELANGLVDTLSPSNTSNASRVLSIIDSSWFPNYEGVMQEFDASFVNADFAIPSCGSYIRPIGQYSEEFPCCASMSCVHYDYLPNVLSYDNHVFVIQSLYDSYLFRLAVVNNPPTFGPEDAPPEAWILHSMSSLRATSLISNPIYLDATTQEKQLTTSLVATFQPACSQHIYMCNGMFDCGKYFFASTYDDTYRAEFKVSILSANWNSVSIGGTTLKESISEWFQFAVLNQSHPNLLSQSEKLSHVSSISHVDTCSGLNCNPTCPGSFVLTAVVASWDWNSFRLSMSLLSCFSILFLLLSAMIFVSGNSVLPYKFLQHSQSINMCHYNDDASKLDDVHTEVDDQFSPRKLKAGGKRVSVALHAPMLDRKSSVHIMKGKMNNHSGLSHIHEVMQATDKPFYRTHSQELDALDALQLDSPASMTLVKDRTEGGGDNRQASLDRIPTGDENNKGQQDVKTNITKQKKDGKATFVSEPKSSEKQQQETSESKLVQFETPNKKTSNLSIEQELAAVLGGDEEVATVALSSPTYDAILTGSGKQNKLLRQYSRKVHGESDRNETPSKRRANDSVKMSVVSPQAQGRGDQAEGRRFLSSKSTEGVSQPFKEESSEHHRHHRLRWRRHSHAREHHRTVIEMAEEKGLVANIDVVRLNYDIEIKSGAKKGQKKRLLHDVNVHFPACTLTAIMGSSGCGKTTLLDMIAGRRHNGIASGGIFYGSKSASRDSSWLRHHCAYVLQLGEPWVGSLSVYDELMLAAALRLPVETSYEERSSRVHEVIKLVGLANHTNTKIGSNTSAGGLSGGQKRRFSIALQMLKKPTLFFLDEPTSGLDAQSSLSVLNLLKNMTELGITILVTIHQPRREMWNNCFDNVLLMCQGRPAFYGSPQKSVAFFKSTFKTRVEIQQMMSVSQNPADVIIDILSNPSLSVFVLCAYSLSDEYHATYIKLMNAANEDRNTKTHHHAISDNCYRYWMQVVTIWRRTFEAYGAIVRGFVLGSIVAAVIVGLMFLNNETVMQSLAAYFMLHGCVAILAQSMILLPLSDEVSRFWIEFDDGAVSAVTFLLSATLFYCLSLGTAAAFYQLTASVLITPSEMLNTTDLYSSSLVMFVYATNIASIFSGFSILAADIFQAQDFGVGFLCFSGLFGGFLVSEKLSPWFFAWLFQFCPAFYSLQAYFKTILLKNPYPCKFDSDLYCLNNSGEVVLGGIYHTDYSLLTLCIISVSLTFVVIAITITLIKHKSKGRGHGGVLILHPHQITFEAGHHEHDSNLFRVDESRILQQSNNTDKKEEIKDNEIMEESQQPMTELVLPEAIRRFMQLEKLHPKRELIPLSNDANEVLPFSDVGDSIFCAQSNRASDLEKLRLKVFDVFFFHKKHGNKMPVLDKKLLEDAPEAFETIRDRILYEKSVHDNEEVAATIIAIHWRQQQARRAIKTICAEALVWKFLNQIQVHGKPVAVPVAMAVGKHTTPVSPVVARPVSPIK